MNMPSIGRRPFPVADRTREGELYRHMHPRLAGIDLLRVKVADRKAGLDPYDKTIFILEARADERVWANRVLEMCGRVLSTSTDTADGGRRFRATLDADIRYELRLDDPDPPLMEDEPLASRAAPDDAILRIVHPATPALELVEGGGQGPSLLPALERAKHMAALRVDCGCGAPAGQACRCDDVDRMTSALAVRAPVLNCPTCRGTGGGTYNDCPTCDGNGEV